MKQLTIDTGVQEFEINGSGVLRFNPSDPNVYNRFFAAETTLTELDAEAQKRMEQIEADFPDDNQRVGAELAVLAEYDRKIKEVLNGVFGAGNDFDEILHGVNLAAVAGNGRRVVTNLLDALTPIIREGAERSMEEKPTKPCRRQRQTAPHAALRPRNNAGLDAADHSDGWRETICRAYRLPRYFGHHRPPAEHR